MEIIEINAERRLLKGKGNARKLRRNGYIPAVFYSKGKDTQMLSIEARNFTNLVDKGLKVNRFLRLSLSDGSKSIDALLKDMHLDPVSDEILHLDFFEVDIRQAMDVEVPVKILNEELCKGISEDGGILHMHTRSVNVHALPMSVPKEIEIYVQDLKIGDSILVKDMPVIEGLEYIDAEDSKIVSLVLRKIVELEPEVEEEAEVEEGKEGEGVKADATGKEEVPVKEESSEKVDGGKGEKEKA